MDIISAINNEKLFKPIFKDIETWSSWIVLLKALFALKMSKPERILYQQCTGRQKSPKKPFREAVCICGRRSGKSFMASVIACFLALFFDYRQYLGPGERASIVIIAADRSQTRTIFNYISGILHSNEVFENCIETELKERISLNNRIDIEILTASHRTVRGRTIAAVLLDEAAFFYQEGARPDTEIYRALKPSTATIPSSLVLIISSPYAQTGLLYEMHKRFFGVDDPETMVWVADTLTMNPTLDKKIIERAVDTDPEAAESEWYARFRRDIAAFLSIEVIEACTVPGRYELPPLSDHHYRAFVDSAGGGGTDWMTLAIGHKDGEKMILDCIRAVPPPFDPFVVTEDFVKVLREYRCNSVEGDKYAGDWPSTAFGQHGIRYVPSTKTKSEIYLAAEPLFSRGQVELLDHKQLFDQLRNLERRTRRAGRDLVDHPLRGHDDVANSVCGALVNLGGSDGFFGGCDLG
ncbi:MAG: terminase family protein [Deltaproteobacteria bacterium]|nr:MAG: terminase family protein [Deltaproteobacteria bacterium]